ncbi:hypothetical protein [Rubellicoccus peritrichatus]|uniref:Uncharacterized protein n=1 Tax=Rubellicoccus peritrichatus TaxID=3080537 RepID=A0AAQ3QTL8_9BACT|nr:hypothetical protein [Puniceicoccus sp. CR14]WOO41461.1 hypothetical protein RZN69_00065 [Puniceicoccus sp. CR14]
MDIESPILLKIKAALFLVISGLSAGLLLALFYSVISWQVIALFFLCIWSFCRAYYFCFYVMEHYADPNYKYAGLYDLFLHLAGLKKSKTSKRCDSRDLF